MSTFYFEDTCALKCDPSIIGTIENTWSEIDSDFDLLQERLSLYIHKDLPANVLEVWYDHERLFPGYVIISFINQPCDGYCIIHESSLLLVDRGIAAGDCVKRSPSDAQSGIIISTSLMCTLQPLCSEAEYNRRQRPAAQGFMPSYGPYTPKSKPKPNGLPIPQSTSPLDTSPMPSSFRVPSQELTYWHSYREEDFVIFNDWVGQVECVYNEVTIRLSNGSVVVVEDSGELDEPYWIPGSKSHELVQRLDRAGFYRHCRTNHPPGVRKPDTVPAEPCYPGQYVQTKRENLRCGRWKFGAYDPAVSPTGIVVDVRCIQLEIRWLYPNQSKPLQDHADPPASLLEIDELESGEIMVYDRGRIPKTPTADQLSNASYSPDTGFGHRVRFRDPAGAALKYGVPVDPEIGGSVSASSHFRRIPRSATQGFDMNVLQVTSTSTTALVRWQDCTVTEEISTGLYPYLNPDGHDVWPGDKVSYIPDEVHLKDSHTGSSTGTTRLKKVGVVQYVDAVERIASVGWFDNPDINMDKGKIWQIPGLTYGEIGNETTVVSLYEIAAHDALRTNIADGVIILPESSAAANENVGGSGLLTTSIQNARGVLELAGGVLGVLPSSAAVDPDAVSRVVPSVDENGWRNVDWCGEIVDLCLDGQIKIRLGAALDVRDIKIPAERILVFAPADPDDGSAYTDEDGNASDWTDELSVGDSETDPDSDDKSVGALDVSIEYEGGEILDGAGDDSMWTTDDETPEDSDIRTTNDDGPSVITCSLGPAAGQAQAKAPPEKVLGRADRAVSFASYPSMPEQYTVLEGTPNDHHYASRTEALTPQMMRRIMKENEIMRCSLPDGVFVRTWESRWDLLRVLIVGPHDTPYEFAPFVFDLHFGAQFPTSPPDAFFHSWTDNMGRINPNLYEDGMICLSLLGTWDADERNEAWSSKTSTVLQIIVSLMGLVLVKEPYYSKFPCLFPVSAQFLMTCGHLARVRLLSTCCLSSMM